MKSIRWNLITQFQIIFLNGLISAYLETEKCSGETTCSLSRSSYEKPIDKYRRLYTGCKLVRNNLVLAHLKEGDDVSFLADIEEVNGAIVLFRNKVESIPLRNLRLIRGASVFVPYASSAPVPTSTTLSPPVLSVRNNGLANNTGIHNDLQAKNEVNSNGNTGDSKMWKPRCEEIEDRSGQFVGEVYSLYVGSNKGLKHLEFTSLEEILTGGVTFEDNRNKSFGHLEHSIDWKYIFNKNSYSNQPPSFFDESNDKFECDESCQLVDSDGVFQRFCWGPEPNMCQKF